MTNRERLRIGAGAVAGRRLALWRRWTDDFIHDVVYAGRQIRQHVGFSIIAIATLALGIGANSAIFSVIHGVLLRPLPYPHANRLVTILERKAAVDASGPSIEEVSLTAPQLMELRSQTTSLARVGAYASTTLSTSGQMESARFETARLSADVLPMLGVAPLVGRAFSPADEVAGAQDVGILSYETWQRHFGGTGDIVGRPLTLDGRTVVVIGVMPEGFRFPEPQTQLWIPYKLAADAPERRFRTMAPLALLADGIAMAAATAEVTTILKQFDVADDPTSEFMIARVQDELVAPVRPALLVVAVAVGLTLLIACVNVASLLLARNALRQREMAIRVAIGASRGRLIRQGLTESVLLAMIGAGMGIWLALGGVRLVRTLGSGLARRDVSADALLPRLEEVAVDWSVLAFTLLIAVLTGIVCGLLPALGRPPRDFQALLNPAATSVTGFGTRHRMDLQRMLVVAEIAVATVLLLGGGLLIRSFVNLSRVNPGYDPHDLLTFQVSAPAVSTGDARRVLADQVLARLSELSRVQAVGYAESIPMVRTVRHMPLRLVRNAPPAPPPRSLTRPVAEHPDARLVSTDFLTAMGMRVGVGRGFGPNDGAGQPRVMLINRALARTGFLGPSPLGAQVYIIDKTAWEVIGIVDDIRQTGLAADADPQIFLDFRQAPIDPWAAGDAYFAVRTDAPRAIASHVRSLVREVSPQSAVDHIASMDQILSHSLSSPRFFAVLLGLFAAVATALATIGIYGTMAYMATWRTREIGIRIALGARRDQVLRLMLGQGVAMASLGIATGLVGALPLARVLRRMLFGVTALDPVTFVAVPVLFLAVAILASYLPTRHAASIDPWRALRTDE